MTPPLAPLCLMLDAGLPRGPAGRDRRPALTLSIRVDRRRSSIHGHAARSVDVEAHNVRLGACSHVRVASSFVRQHFRWIRLADRSLRPGQRRGACWLECALHLCKGLLACVPVICPVCFVSPCQSADGRFHRRPASAERFFSCRDRARRWLIMEQPYHALRRRSPGCDSRLNLGIDLDPRSINILRAGARPTWLR
jgi:hypothetical protein